MKHCQFLNEKMKRCLVPLLLITVLLAPPGVAQRSASTPAAAAAPTATAALPRYIVTDLGTLGGASEAHAISNNGKVAGMYNPGGGYQAFLWEDGVMQGLGTLGGTSSEAHGVNDAGQVVGYSVAGNGYIHAFLWQNGAMQDLGTLPGGEMSLAFAINNAGQVAGHSDTAAYQLHAFRWSGGLADLGTLPGGDGSWGYAINENGQVAGASRVALYPDETTHAFLWSGSMQDLGALGWTHSYAFGMNDNGAMVGRLINAGLDDWHAFLSQGGGMQDLGGTNSTALDINNDGLIVGESGLSPAQQAMLWENGQMKNLNNLIPADSGWVLQSARAINEKGQIVGKGSFNGQTRAFLLKPPPPVLIVPGIAGTYSSNTLLGMDYGWLTHRGVHPDDLQIDPLGRVYHDLIQTLKNVGYVEGKTLFVVKYDWRLMPGPVSTNGPFDGHIAGLNAQALSDEQFLYGVDYMGYYLRKASEAYRAEHGGDLSEVNIISHSTGGLVARTYIQSGAYGGEYDAGNHYNLPEVDQFIMVGVPNRGASKAWNPMHNNWIADTAYRVLLSKIINRAFQKVTAVFGATIQGPDYNIDKASIMVNGAPDPELFIEKYVPTVRSLLATYDFIDFGAGFVTVNNDPALRNNLVLDLNNGLDLAPTADPNLFADLTKATIMCGASESTAHLVVERTGTAANDVLLPFSDFLANDASVTDEWYGDIWLPNGGDQTVPLESCQEQFIGDGRVNIRLFSGANTDHTGLMSNVDVQSAMLDIFKVEYETQDISTGAWPGFQNVISVISDPAETILVDGAGRRLGYSQATGVLTEIPGSSWFGDAEGFGFITGDFVEPLHMELTGLGEDYFVMVSVDRFGRPAGGTVNSGFLGQGEMIPVPISLNLQYVFLPRVTR